MTYKPMLEVRIGKTGRSTWEWRVVDRGELVMSGNQPSRDEARHAGNGALFRILASDWYSNEQPETP